MTLDEHAHVKRLARALNYVSDPAQSTCNIPGCLRCLEQKIEWEQHLHQLYDALIQADFSI